MVKARMLYCNDERWTINDEQLITSCVALTIREKGVAAVVPVEDLNLLEAIEDRLDLEDIEKALADPENKEAIPWEKVKKEFGLWIGNLSGQGPSYCQERSSFQIFQPRLPSRSSEDNKTFSITAFACNSTMITCWFQVIS